MNPAPPTTMFDLRKPSLKEVEEVIKAARSASAPSPRCVSYCSFCIKVCKGSVEPQRWVKIQRRSVSFGPSHCWVLTVRWSSALFLGDSHRFFSRRVAFLEFPVAYSTLVSHKAHQRSPWEQRRLTVRVLWLDLANMYGLIQYRLVDLLLHHY